jgi:hypothetical protein
MHACMLPCIHTRIYPLPFSIPYLYSLLSTLPKLFSLYPTYTPFSLPYRHSFLSTPPILPTLYLTYTLFSLLSTPAPLSYPPASHPARLARPRARAWSRCWKKKRDEARRCAADSSDCTSSVCTAGVYDRCTTTCEYKILFYIRRRLYFILPACTTGAPPPARPPTQCPDRGAKRAASRCGYRGAAMGRDVGAACCRRRAVDGVL